MNQSLNHYYIFYMVATYRNFSTVAKKLFISQPAVSKAVGKLETELGSQLFYRTSKGVIMTESGEILYRQLKIAFQAIECGEEELRKQDHEENGKLSIGTSTTLCKYVLLPYLREFIPQNPNIQLTISCQSGLKTIEDLENQKLDLGIISETDRVPFYPLRTIHYAFVSTEDYLKKLRKQIYIAGKTYTADSDLFAYATLLLLRPGDHSRQYVDRYLESNRIGVGQIIELSSTDLIIDFAKTGLGVACVIRDYVETEIREGTLVTLSTSVPIPPRRIGLSYPSGLPLSRPMERFLQGFHI